VRCGARYSGLEVAARRNGSDKEVILKSVRQVLNEKGYAVETVTPETSVYDALQKLSNLGVGALVVVKDGEIRGLISERDYARKGILQGRHAKDTRVEEIMTRRVITVEPQQTVEACMVLMTEKRIRHLPVVEEGRLVGIVSIGDVVKAIIEAQRLTIEELERYVTSGR
jgi:CBS domain-containing protein